jgi:eukaryotic-like serine/threonine-protein kinase
MPDVKLVEKLLKERYFIQEKLGEGSFGETYLALDKLKFDSRCVVKRLKPQDQSILVWVQQAFEQEAKMLEQLGKHPQIPDLLAYFQEQKDFFLVQEFIDGNSLRTELVVDQKWDENRVVFLLQDILKVLEFVHRNSVIHRDIKPDNIIRTKTGKIVLIDFGAVKKISTQVFNTKGQVALTTTVVGTHGYMPVEQMRGHLMFCSDIYAVGMIGIEALTGIMPSCFPLNTNNLEVDWRSQAQIGDNLANYLDKMVCYNPNNRYQSASEALQAIHELAKTIVTPVGIVKESPTIITSKPSTAVKIQPSLSTKYAGFSIRLVADLIDKTILIISSFFWDFITQDNTNSTDETFFRFLITYVILGFLYCPVMESSNIQGTLGKKLLGIIVTDINGHKLSFEKATKRHSMKFFSYITIWMGFFMAGWTNKKQALHDKICKTLVLRK